MRDGPARRPRRARSTSSSRTRPTCARRAAGARAGGARLRAAARARRRPDRAAWRTSARPARARRRDRARDATRSAPREVAEPLTALGYAGATISRISPEGKGWSRRDGSRRRSEAIAAIRAGASGAAARRRRLRPLRLRLPGGAGSSALRREGPRRRQPFAMIASSVDMLIECVPELRGRVRGDRPHAAARAPSRSSSRTRRAAIRMAQRRPTRHDRRPGRRAPDRRPARPRCGRRRRCDERQRARASRRPRALDEVPASIRDGLRGRDRRAAGSPGLASTVIDFSGREPAVLRDGAGEPPRRSRSSREALAASPSPELRWARQARRKERHGDRAGDLRAAPRRRGSPRSIPRSPTRSAASSSASAARSS